MKLKQTIGYALLSLVLSGGSLAPGQSTPPGPQDYEGFSHFVAQRNIFNPDRYPRTSRYTPRRPEKQSHRHATPGFSFVGAMEYEKGTFAFFDGNNDDYRKSLQVGGSIAGYTVQRITLGGVSLTTGSNTLFLAVGAQMRRSSDGTWDLADEPQDFSNPADSSTSAPSVAGTDTSGSAAAPAAPTGEMSDVLKRLMKLREQENK
jgi:hypothetical protein